MSSPAVVNAGAWGTGRTCNLDAVSVHDVAGYSYGSTCSYSTSV